MKALIAAGGKGTRLRPITHTRNKHLIPIANKPILHYALEYVAAAGIREAGIIVNADSNEVQEALGTGERWGLKITYIPQTAPLGLAHCVKIGQDFIGREPFVFYLGDNMVVGGIERFRDEFLARKSNCHLALARVRDPERFGVPEIAGDRIVSVAGEAEGAEEPVRRHRHLLLRRVRLRGGPQHQAERARRAGDQRRARLPASGTASA